MEEYPKIESLYNRDEKTGKFKLGDFRLPEFKYLYSLPWRWTEKIDGTNIRIEWTGEKFNIGGRTANAQIPTFLYNRLLELFSPEKFKGLEPLCLYGEGFGAKIQKGGGDYLPGGGCDFRLFDVLVGDWWLRWKDICDVANKLNIQTVPVVAEEEELFKAEEIVREGFDSMIGIRKAEGLVCIPMENLRTRRGDRIVVKLKTRDY